MLFGKLGKRQRTCPRGWTYDMSCNCCIQTSGGGSARTFIQPNGLLGVATNNPLDPTTKSFSQQPADIFSDPVQWAKENPVLAIGAAITAYLILK